jgi:hypothetical protein
MIRRANSCTSCLPASVARGPAWPRADEAASVWTANERKRAMQIPARCPSGIGTCTAGKPWPTSRA